jgi:hypothetical protein
MKILFLFSILIKNIHEKAMNFEEFAKINNLPNLQSVTQKETIEKNKKLSMKKTETFKNNVTKETEKNDLEARKKEFEEFMKNNGPTIRAILTEDTIYKTEKYMDKKENKIHENARKYFYQSETKSKNSNKVKKKKNFSKSSKEKIEDLIKDVDSPKNHIKEIEKNMTKTEKDKNQKYEHEKIFTKSNENKNFNSNVNQTQETYINLYPQKHPSYADHVYYNLEFDHGIILNTKPKMTKLQRLRSRLCPKKVNNLELPLFIQDTEEKRIQNNTTQTQSLCV